jgi:hypothetical protein
MENQQDDNRRLSLVWTRERRIATRRGVARGGRRARDQWSVPGPACDGCGKPTGMQLVCTTNEYYQYWCRHCACRVFIAR